MKQLVLLFAAMLLLGGSALAQTVITVSARPLTEEDIKLLRQDVQASKEDIIKKSMQFTDAEATAFWPVYREYAGAQVAIADKRLGLLTEYVQNLDKMEDATANSLTDRFFKIEDETQNLRQRYYPKFVAAIGGKRAAKFYQVDNRLSMMVNLQLASEIPLIP